MALTTTFYTYLVIHYQITLGSSAAMLEIAEEVHPELLIMLNVRMTAYYKKKLNLTDFAYNYQL